MLWIKAELQPLGWNCLMRWDRNKLFDQELQLNLAHLKNYLLLLDFRKKFRPKQFEIANSWKRSDALKGFLFFPFTVSLHD